MDAAKQNAIQACGRCGQPEDAHKHKTGTSEEDLALFAAPGGPCASYVASDAAVIYQKYLAISGGPPSPRKPGGPIPKRIPLCARCGHRHRGECVL